MSQVVEVGEPKIRNQGQGSDLLKVCLRNVMEDNVSRYIQNHPTEANLSMTFLKIALNIEFGGNDQRPLKQRRLYTWLKTT